MHVMLKLYHGHREGVFAYACLLYEIKPLIINMIYKVSQANIQYGHLMPPEDSMLENGRIFCVADGVTMEISSPKNFDYKRALLKYPNPSKARMVADIFCKSFVDYLNGQKPSLKEIKTAFVSGNKAIEKFNKKHTKKINYLNHDLSACVASGGVITNNKLYWGNICDCGIIIFSKNGKVKFQTPNLMNSFVEYEKKYLQRPNFNFSNPKYRIMIRSEHRNKKAKVIKGMYSSYGALTGEKIAEDFMNFGKIELNKGDLIIFYTDGFEHTVQNKKFFKTIYKKTESLIEQSFVPYDLTLAKKDPEMFGRERTLIAYINK